MKNIYISEGQGLTLWFDPSKYQMEDRVFEAINNVVVFKTSKGLCLDFSRVDYGCVTLIENPLLYNEEVTFLTRAQVLELFDTVLDFCSPLINEEQIDRFLSSV